MMRGGAGLSGAILLALGMAQTLSAQSVYQVSGRLAEFPGCNSAMRGWKVTLQPLGASTRTDVSGGIFVFNDVPPGDYELIASPGCNPFGCWPPKAVSVVESDVYTNFCMQESAPGTPTPFPTPTIVTGPPPPVFEAVEARPNPARPGSVVLLDGSRSTGSTFTWRQQLGIDVVLNTSHQSATFIAPLVHRSSDMAFELRICSVASNQERCESQRLQLKIEPEPECVGDCNANGSVEIQELVRSVSIALNRADIASCRAIDLELDSLVLINELVEAVGNALRGCPTSSPSPSNGSPTPTTPPASTCTQTPTPPAIAFTPSTTPTPQEFPVPGCCEFNTGECENQAGAAILTCVLGSPDGLFGRFFDFHTCQPETGRCLAPTPTPACAIGP